MEGWQRAGEMKRLYINVAQYFLFLACPVLKWRYLIEKNNLHVLIGIQIWDRT